MKIEVSKNPISSLSADVAVVFAFSGKKTYEPTKALLSVDKALDGALTTALSSEKFKGEGDSTVTVYTLNKIPATKVLVVGLGTKKDLKLNTLRVTIGKIVKAYNKKIDSLILSLLGAREFVESVENQAFTLTEGALLGSYSFSLYKKKKDDERAFETIIISHEKAADHKKINEAIEKAEQYAQATFVARDLVNEQAAVATPEYLAKFAKSIAAKNPEVRCTVYNKAQIEKMGMGAFLGIAKAAGESVEPRFIYLSYKPKRPSKKKLAIVGKGITFDTGGISIKPEAYMTTMKCDMAGAAAVLGIFSVISHIKCDFEVMGLIAATPNLISATSLLPGDVVRAMNGKTIEVLNTDAEGRVTMADSLSFAIKEGATEIIDLATLTGACVVALGDDIAGLFSNNKELATAVKVAAEKAGEDVWELPLPAEYKDMNKSEIADISNLGSSRYGGAITAALFLQEFVDEKPWVHLDIAGPAFYEKEYPLGSKGGSGFGVRTLLNYLQQRV